MKKNIFIIIFISLCIFTTFCQEDTTGIGFGLQSVLINPNIDNKILSKRVLSATQYKLTPGDTYTLVIKMEKKESVNLILHDDYQLELPYLGAIDVKGMYFTELRNQIIKRIKDRFPVEYVDFVLSSPALFDIFIYGGVENPGITSVIPITRVTEAIALAKGLKKGSSYRQVKLIRGDKTIICDLTKFVMEADLSQNPLLEPGDKIYVPHAEILTNISGRVKYPDTYELVPGETLLTLINTAGGILPGSTENNIQIVRIGDDGAPLFVTATLSDAASFLIKHGDKISIRANLKNQEMILLEAVLFGKPPTGEEPQKIPTKPLIVNIPYMSGITLLNILDRFGGPTPLADAKNSFIIRAKDKSKVLVDADRLWEERDPAIDITINPGDHIFIPIKKLKIVVAGQVNNPGSFTYFTGSRVSDYIAQAGGFNLDTANMNGVYLMDKDYNRINVSLSADVKPGSVIYVDKRLIEHSKKSVSNILIFVLFAAEIVGLTAAIVNLVADLN